MWRAICRHLQPHVAEHETRLELGSGYGEFRRFIRAREKWVLDVNSPLIQSALAPLPLESGSVGTIVASNFFEHFRIPDGERILREVARVLRPGGRLIVVPPNFRLEPRRFLGDFTHQTLFTGVGFTDFLRSLGFRLLHSEPRYLPFSMQSRLPKWGWLVDLYLALPYHPPAGQFLVVAEAPPRS